MKKRQELRMKWICFLLLLLLNSVSATFEMNDTVKSDRRPAAVNPESVRVVESELREAAQEHEEKRAEFVFHSVMFGFIVVGSLFFIIVALIKAICAPQDKEQKLLASESFDVEKQPWI